MEKVCSSWENCVSDKQLCDKCSRNKKNWDIEDKFVLYKPACPFGRENCINDPAHIKHFGPNWYKKLYGEVSIEEALSTDGCCCCACDGYEFYDDECK